MSRPWLPEVLVSPELARKLIASAFPELAPVGLEPFGEGWDNTAFLVNEAWVFRFPRRQIAAECLEAEIRVLPQIAPLLPLAVPVPRYVGRPGAEFRWPFAGYRRIEGRTACAVGLDERERVQLAEPLGRFLAALHNAALSGAGPDRLGRLDLGKRVPWAYEQLDRLQAVGLVSSRRAYEMIVEDARRVGMGDAGPGRLALVHGDLYSRHLLLDECRQLCGVIDWGDVHRGAPAIDLSIAHSFLPPNAHDAFCRAYGPIDERAWALARFRALYHSAAVAVYAHEIADADLLREAALSLRLLAAN
jgi:aminoglycoside phosphotransferase (APT) family kinase protein